MTVNNDFMTSSEVCKYLDISTSVLNGLEKTGELKPQRKLPTSHKRLYLKEDVDKFLKSITTN